MELSILTSTKKILGVDAAYAVFDLDIITHINSTLSTLTQLGIGPSTGFMIEDATSQWPDFLGADPELNAVKTYVFLKVRMLFDPPASSYAVTAMKEQIQELEWRLNVKREEDTWVDPATTTTPTKTSLSQPLTTVDGGTP